MLHCSCGRCRGRKSGESRHRGHLTCIGQAEPILDFCLLWKYISSSQILHFWGNGDFCLQLPEKSALCLQPVNRMTFPSCQFMLKKYTWLFSLCWMFQESSKFVWSMVQKLSNWHEKIHIFADSFSVGPEAAEARDQLELISA